MKPSFLRAARAAALVLPVLLGATPPQAADAALDKARAALEVLREKHDAARTVSLAFESRAEGADGRPMPAVKGSLVTGDSGRFRLAHAHGTVVSDGEALWQYAPSTGQVIVRPAAAAGGAGGVLRRFLQARPVAAAFTGGALRVALDPASVGEPLDSLVLTLSRDGATVAQVDTRDAAGNRVAYVVTALRFDARIRRDAFTFEIPEDAEVVDMR